MVNFKSIIDSKCLYNFHSHTQFCDGHEVMEAFVKEAVCEGFEYYGFTPHSPIPFSTTCNMPKESVPAYINEFYRLKGLYGDRINLFCSMEIDYIDEDWGPNNEYFDNLDLDYKIGSIHFIPSFVNPQDYIDIDGKYDAFKVKMAQYFNNDIESVVRSFYRQSIKMIDAGGFDIIGHFDKIGHNGSHFRPGLEDEQWYQVLARETFDAIMDNSIIIEINTKAWQQHNRFFPNLAFWKWLKEYEVPVLINSDAHYPTLINAGREEALRLLQ